jgi:hypothetical protein
MNFRGHLKAEGVTSNGIFGTLTLHAWHTPKELGRTRKTGWYGATTRKTVTGTESQPTVFGTEYLNVSIGFGTE